MTWEVRVPERVGKKAARFPKKELRRLLDALDEFASDPWSGDIAKIKGERDLWRRRVGRYRIIYSADPDRRVVEIKEIARRTTTTYS